LADLLTEIARVEPLRLVAGDTWTWRREDLEQDYPPALWQLSYAAGISGGGPVQVIVADADITLLTHLVQVPAAATVLVAPGRRRWTALMTRSADLARVTLGTGEWEVLPDPANETTDPRSHARRVLDQIDAMIEGRESDVVYYQIEGRAVNKMPLNDLLRFRDVYKREVRAEEARDRGVSARRRRLVVFQ
jgi:hypothetical protein